MSSRDIKQFIKRLERRGYTVERTRGDHYKILDPRGRIAAFTGSTPSDHRVIRNLETTIRSRRHERATH